MRSNLHPKKRVVLYEGQLTVVRQAGSEVRHCILSKDAFEYYAIDDIDGPLGKPLARFPMISSSCMEWIPSGWPRSCGTLWEVMTVQKHPQYSWAKTSPPAQKTGDFHRFEIC